MSNNNETTTKFKVDISELKSAMQEAKRQISVANSEFKAISSSMDNWSRSTDGLQAKLNQLDSNLNNQKKILRSLEDQYEVIVSEQGKGSAAADKLRIAINNQQAVINNTEKEITGYKNELDRVSEAQLEAVRSGKSLDEVLDEAGESAESASGGFTVMKGALAGLVADGIRSAIDALKDFSKQAVTTGMDFEASMSEVAAISGASGDQLKLLEDTAKEYGSTTVFSASEAAQALKYMALAGWDAETASSALGGVLDLAASAGMDLAQASDMVTDYLSAFGLAADKSTYFADMLAYAQSNSNTSAEQLGEAYKNSAASMNAAGQDVETTTALLAMMANQGFKGSEAGTALTAMMRDLTAKMKDGKIMIGDTAIQVMDANGNYRDMTDILKEVESATDGMGDAERSAALASTFTADSTKGLNLLLNAGVGSAEEFEEALRGAGGTAADMGETMNDNLAGDVKEAQSALEDLQIAAYDELQPSLREIVQFATSEIIPMIKEEVIPAVKDFIGWIVDNKDTVVSGLAAIAAGFAAFKVVGLITSVISAVKNLGTALTILKAVMAALGGPVTIIITIIAALVAGFITLWNTSDEFRNFWIGLWETISSAFSAAVSGIVMFFTETIPETFSNAITAIGDFISSAGQSIMEFFTVKIPEYIQAALDWFNDLPYKIGYALGYAIASVIQFGIDLWNFVTTKIPEVINGIVKFFSELPAKLWTWLVNTIAKIIQWRNDMKEKATEAAKGFIENAINFIKELPSKVWTWLQNTISKVSSFASDLKTKGAEAAKNLFNSIVEGITSLPDKVKEIGSNIVKGLWNGIDDMVGWITGKIESFGEGVLGGIKDFFGIHSPSKVMEKEVGKFIPAGIAVGIDKNAKSVLSSMKDLTTDAVVSARSGLSSASGSLSGGSATGGVVNNFYQTNNSPKALSRLEIYRQSKNLLGYAGGV